MSSKKFRYCVPHTRVASTLFCASRRSLSVCALFSVLTPPLRFPRGAPAETHPPLVGYRVEIEDRIKFALDLHLIGDVGGQVVGVNPGRADAGGDAVRGDLRGLRRFQEFDVALVLRVGLGHFAGRVQLAAHVSGEVFVHRFQEAGFRVLDHAIEDSVENGIRVGFPQPGHVFQVRVPEFIEGHGQGVMVGFGVVGLLPADGDLLGEDIGQLLDLVLAGVVIFQGQDPGGIGRVVVNDGVFGLVDGAVLFDKGLVFLLQLLLGGLDQFLIRFGLGRRGEHCGPGPGGRRTPWPLRPCASRPVCRSGKRPLPRSAFKATWPLALT